MHEYFYTLADAITALLKGDEIYTCTFRGEDSDFVRFNRSAVRQAGTVTQRFLNLDLIRGQRHAAADVALSGDLEEDRARLTHAVAELREQLPYLPEDPYLLYATDVQSSMHEGENTLPDSPEAIAAVLDAGRGRIAVQPELHLAGLLDVPGGKAGVQQDDVAGRELDAGLAAGQFEPVHADGGAAAGIVGPPGLLHRPLDVEQGQFVDAPAVELSISSEPFRQLAANHASRASDQDVHVPLLVG